MYRFLLKYPDTAQDIGRGGRARIERHPQNQRSDFSQGIQDQLKERAEAVLDVSEPWNPATSLFWGIQPGIWGRWGPKANSRGCHDSYRQTIQLPQMLRPKLPSFLPALGGTVSATLHGRVLRPSLFVDRSSLASGRKLPRVNISHLDPSIVPCNLAVYLWSFSCRLWLCRDRGILASRTGFMEKHLELVLEGDLGIPCPRCDVRRSHFWVCTEEALYNRLLRSTQVWGERTIVVKFPSGDTWNPGLGRILKILSWQTRKGQVA